MRKTINETALKNIIGLELRRLIREGMRTPDFPTNDPFDGEGMKDTDSDVPAGLPDNEADNDINPELGDLIYDHFESGDEFISFIIDLGDMIGAPEAAQEIADAAESMIDGM